MAARDRAKRSGFRHRQSGDRPPGRRIDEDGR
jgi:hypothetical protein